MKKPLFTILCILFFGLSYAQIDSINTIELEYLRTTNSSTSHKSLYILSIIPTKEVSFFNKKNIRISNNKKLEEDEKNIIWTPKGKNLKLVYKNYKKNQMFLKQMIAFKFFVIKDSLSIFNWKIEDERKNILGYSCQLATTKFRGREYEAWFTTKLPFGGPWKYDGLPGTILSIRSLDGYINYEIMGIKNNKFVSNISINPFQNENYFTWKKFKSLYKKKAIAMSKYKTQSGDEMTIVIPRIRIERYIEDDDTDYMADKEFEKIKGKNN
jgi:GLPGLI family protein